MTSTKTRIFLDLAGGAVQYGVMRPVAQRYMKELPLTEPVFLILLSLADHPQHGYSILKDVDDMSRGRVKLSTGTLYGALRRLLAGRWIERFKEDDRPRGRRAYRLTALGRRNMQLEVSRLKHLALVANLRVARKEL